jgi:predicted enzyme related to lactoylglutathione lyase
MHGRFTWYELYTTDMVAAKKFYPPITGWGVQRWDQSTADNPYEMWTAGGAPFAGLMPLTDEMKAMGAPPHWLSYIEVKNAGETLAKAAGLGAKTVFGPETVPNVGVLAVLADPQGAIIAILQPAMPSDGFDGNPVLGKPSWHELMTTDYKAAYNFYNAVFGFQKLEEMDMGGGMMYLTFSAGTGKKAAGGMFNRMAEMGDIPPNWLVYTNVRDAKGAVGAITRGGGTVINGPMEVPGGDWIVAFMDPQGGAHAVHAVAAKAVANVPKKAAKAKKKLKARAKATRKKIGATMKKAGKKAKKAGKKAMKAAKKAQKAAKKAIKKALKKAKKKAKKR